MFARRQIKLAALIYLHFVVVTTVKYLIRCEDGDDATG